MKILHESIDVSSQNSPSKRSAKIARINQHRMARNRRNVENGFDLIFAAVTRDFGAKTKEGFVDIKLRGAKSV